MPQLRKTRTTPILRLVEAMRRVTSEDDYSIRVENWGDDELGVLNDGFNAMLDQIERGRDQAEPEAPFEKGENVKVAKGPFAGFTGTVDELFAERRRVKVIVTIFGRPTPIDLDFLDVQPI